MSHFTTDLQESSGDPFLPTLEDATSSLFGPDEWSNEFYLPFDQNTTDSPSDTGCTDVLDDLNIDSPFLPSDGTPGDPSDFTAIPDLGNFSFGSTVDTPVSGSNPPYPSTPTLGTPHPYPRQLQILQQSALPAPSNGHNHGPQRSSHVRSTTSTDVLRPPIQYTYRSRVNQPYHRRSLSQNDAEKIATLVAAGGPNPQFFRRLPPIDHTLRTHIIDPVPNDANTIANTNAVKRGTVRKDPYHKNASHGHGHGHGHGHRNGRARRAAPTSMPSTTFQSATENAATATLHARRQLARSQQVPKDVPVLHQMPIAERHRCSPRIIEIGAMAVFDSMGRELERRTDRDKDRAKNGGRQYRTDDDVMKMLDQVELHLKRKEGDTEKGLQGCESIRKVLSLRTGGDMRRDGDTVNGEEGEGSKAQSGLRLDGQSDENLHDGTKKDAEVDLELPSDVFSEEENEMYLSTDEGDLFGLLHDTSDAIGFGTDTDET
ncbi:hypothetical protein K491DRAFT_681078 [Lophiostoma macrostomum CBS 122681]|uniref:Uncharacterized protein n=1 Tax=Lophiostoma macrostomum CBS 122681 TaxID=1314788 RepID=A0A6A6SZ09_9PLEO|nr:hypothetical protein K491DRAFT_681078 [Lophiostoma macrostomum CBS 122681]